MAIHEVLLTSNLLNYHHLDETSSHATWTLKNFPWVHKDGSGQRILEANSLIFRILEAIENHGLMLLCVGDINSTFVRRDKTFTNKLDSDCFWFAEFSEEKALNR